MRNIVYILGAGFSAPAGIPVMRDFLRAAQDIRQNHPGDNKYSYFGKILDQLSSPTRILPYYKADTFNIEEILSILEMESLITQKGKTKVFEQFITDVIDYHSEPLKSNKVDPFLNTLQATRANNPLLDYYVPFILNIFQCNLELRDDVRYERGKTRFVVRFRELGINKPSYSVITLNYDMLLEDAVNYINQFVPPDRHLTWLKPTVATAKNGSKKKVLSSKDTVSNRTVPLAHLHGCTDGLGLISPTWNKSHIGSRNKQAIFGNWPIAHHALQNANEIRFLGYSLPESDSYIKYLLKSAGLTCRNLQRVSAICLDSDGTVKKRYTSLFNEGTFRFAHGDIAQYLQGCGPQNTISTMHEKPLPLPWTIEFDTLERIHEATMKSSK